MPFYRLLSLLESIGVVSETACHPWTLALVSYGGGYHVYCLSAGCFLWKSRFCNIMDWIAIIEFREGLLHTFRDVLACNSWPTLWCLVPSCNESNEWFQSSKFILRRPSNSPASPYRFVPCSLNCNFTNMQFVRDKSQKCIFLGQLKKILGLILSAVYL